MDSQQLEIIGRQVLVKALIEADLEVATPLRDRGVDILAYEDWGETCAFVAAYRERQEER